MASGGADMSESFLQNAACRPDIPDIADGNNVIRFIHSADECPLDSFKRKAEVGHLRYQVIAFDPAEMYERHFVDNAAMLQREAQGVKRRRRQFRPFDAAHQVLIR